MEMNSTPKSARRVTFQVQDDQDNEHNGIARKVVNIDGTPLLLRRGKFINAKPVMESQDELAEKVLVSKCDVGSLEKDKSKDSYAASLQSNPLIKQVNFRFFYTLEKQQGVDVVLPRESVKMVQDKLAFTLYGYFIGDREAFPVMKYFVQNNWKKYGLQKIMMNANGFFFG
ncbi:hypothetical protein QVD17_39517 [Tagetes erecta]|uniref:Uncharacterized protein n=1 Tax=Tagetes erecta TaxID=13708 RepID=A0AAD8JU83_TARER|nr:hypothetical protein QVD17_39517 [Tagetes erecta]